MRHVLRILVITAAVSLLAGCGGDKKQDRLPEARPLLETAATTVQTAESFGVEIDVNGYPVTLSVGDLTLPEGAALTFKYAKGAFQAPDRIEANVEIGLGDFGTTADLIAIAHEHYLRGDLITAGQWISAELIAGFTPASLMTEDGGIAHALNSITSLEMVGKKDLDGVNVYHLRGKVRAVDVNALTFGLIRTQEGELDIDVYILVEEKQVEQIVLQEPPPADIQDSEDTIWTISFMDYNQPVSITPPDVSTGS